MTATGGLMGGQQIFRKDESSTGCVIKQSIQRETRYTDYIFTIPSYPRGLVIMIALIVSGLILTAGQMVIYFFSNRRKRRVGELRELDNL